MRFNLNLILIEITVLVLTLSACTEKGQPVVDHHPDQRKSAPPITDPASESTGADLEVAGVDALLDLQNIRRSEWRAQKSLAFELHALNQNLLAQFKASAKTDLASTDTSSIEAKYIDVINLDCGAILKDCTGLRYLDLAANSSLVVLEIARRYPENRFKYLNLAIYLNNGEWSQDLYLELLKKPDEFVTQAEERYRIFAIGLIETAIQNAISVNSTVKGQAELLATLPVWDILENNPLGFSEVTRRRIASLMADHHMFVDKDAKMQPRLKVWLDRLTANPALLVGQNSIQHGLKVTPTIVLLDSVFSGIYPSSMMAPLIKGLRPSVAGFSLDVDTYSRARFKQYLQTSSVAAQRLFSSGVSVEKLLFYALKESKSIRRIWSEFQTGVDRLKPLSLDVLKNLGAPESDVDRIRFLLESTSRSIVLAAEYPHMMALFYKLSKKRFNIFIPFFGQISSSDLANLLYQGKLPPLFGYSEESTELNQYEILMSFDFAVRSGVFEAADIDLDDYISDTVNRFVEGPYQNSKKAFDALDLRFRETPTAKQLLGICRELDEPSFHFKRIISLEEINKSPYYGELYALSQEALSSRSSYKSPEPGSLEEVTLGVFFPDHVLSEALETSRFDLGAASRKARFMVESYKNHLKTADKSSDMVENPTEKSLALIERLDTERQRHMNEFMRFQQMVGGCYIPIAQRNQDYQRRLIDYEVDHLRAVHQVIKALRAGETPKYKPELARMPSDFKGYDRIDKEGYRIHQIDTLLRVAKYLESGIETDAVKLAALAPHIEVNLGGSFDLDRPLVRDSKSAFLPFVESEDEFIASGVRALIGERFALLDWHLGKSSPSYDWEYHLANLVSAHRLSTELGRPKPEQDEIKNSMIEGQLALADYIRIQDQDRKIMEILGQIEKMDPINLVGRFINASGVYPFRMRDTYGLLDLVAIMGQEPELGWAWQMQKIKEKPPTMPPERESYAKGPKMYFRAMDPSNRASTLVPYSLDSDKALATVYGEFFQNEINAAADVLRTVETKAAELESLPADERPYTNINTLLEVRDILSRSQVDTFYANLKKISQSTNGLIKVPAR